MPKYVLVTKNQRLTYKDIPTADEIASIAKLRQDGRLKYISFPSVEPIRPGQTLPDKFLHELEAFQSHKVKHYIADGYVEKKVEAQEDKMFYPHRNWLIISLASRVVLLATITQRLKKEFKEAGLKLFDRKEDPIIEVDYTPTFGFSFTVNLEGSLDHAEARSEDVNDVKAIKRTRFDNFRLQVIVKEIPDTKQKENTEFHAECQITNNFFSNEPHKLLIELLSAANWHSIRATTMTDMDATLFSTKLFNYQLTPHVLVLLELSELLDMFYAIGTNRYFLDTVCKIVGSLEKNPQSKTIFLNTLHYVKWLLETKYNLQPEICTLFDYIAPGYCEKMLGWEQELVRRFMAKDRDENFVKLVMEIASIVSAHEKNLLHLTSTVIIDELQDRAITGTFEFDAEKIDGYLEDPLIAAMLADLDLYRRVHEKSPDVYCKVTHVRCIQQPALANSHAFASVAVVDDMRGNIHGQLFHFRDGVTEHQGVSFLHPVHVDSRLNDDPAIFKEMLIRVAKQTGIAAEVKQFLRQRNFSEAPQHGYAVVKYLLLSETHQELLPALIGQFYQEAYHLCNVGQQNCFDELLAHYDTSHFVNTHQFIGNVRRDFNICKCLITTGKATDKQLIQFFDRRYPYLSKKDKETCVGFIDTQSYTLRQQLLGLAEWHNPTFTLKQKLKHKRERIPSWLKKLTWGSGIVGGLCFIGGVACPAAAIGAAAKGAMTWGGLSVGLATPIGHGIHVAVKKPHYLFSGDQNQLYYEPLTEPAGPGPRYAVEVLSATASPVSDAKAHSFNQANIQLALRASEPMDLPIQTATPQSHERKRAQLPLYIADDDDDPIPSIPDTPRSQLWTSPKLAPRPAEEFVLPAQALAALPGTPEVVVEVRESQSVVVLAASS